MKDEAGKITPGVHGRNLKFKTMKTKVIEKGAKAATPAQEEPTALNKRRAEMKRIKDADRAKAREAAKAKKTAKHPKRPRCAGARPRQRRPPRQPPSSPAPPPRQAR